MAKKTSKKQFLAFFRDLCEVSKNNLFLELNKATEQGTFNFETLEDKQRFFALFGSLLDNENAETYLKLEKLTN